ncbi:Gmad2 immunoglobulin-like domain-containing protein [Actinoplanes sp. NPDC020271]|uniref:Gmad2 immunoglobulin-like domain-containing protein n=1 Tax=Actinoplanes sp. NPDC020271 TaxID=3363896 RepID=UPI00378EBBC9
MIISSARRRSVLLIGVFLAVLLAVSGVWLLVRDDGSGGETGSAPSAPAPATSAGVTPSVPAPVTTAPRPRHSTTPPATRPPTTAPSTHEPTLALARATAVRFLSEVVGMRHLSVQSSQWRSDFVATVDVRTDSGSGPVSTVALGKGQASFAVLGVTTHTIVVDQPPFQIDPAYLEVIHSPMTISGSALAFEGNVAVRVVEIRTGATHGLGEGHVVGGGDVMRSFTGEITFAAPSAETGWVLAFERSARDGHITKATVVRVAFVQQPA